MGGSGLSGNDGSDVVAGPNGSIWGGNHGSWIENSSTVPGDAAAIGQGAGHEQGALWDQFLASPEGAPWASQVEALKAARTGNNRIITGGQVLASVGGQLTDISPLINTFKQWQSGQATAYDAFTKYADLAKNQPGRDATILTGPAVAPDTALASAGRRP